MQKQDFGVWPVELVWAGDSIHKEPQITSIGLWACGTSSQKGNSLKLTGNIIEMRVRKDNEEIVSLLVSASPVYLLHFRKKKVLLMENGFCIVDLGSQAKLLAIFWLFSVQKMHL